jgi:lipopolysaccharide/colanic/teichoic acid biosynthesis glycosyltransferase
MGTADLPPSENGWYMRWGKRTLDLLLAILMVVLLAPIMTTVAVLVLFGLGRPVFFRQIRPGRGGKPFELLKFRTMRPARDAREEKVTDGERLTPFGRWLRRTSLDELPELWNVLRGDMSLVGPRPLLMGYLPLYSAEQRRRHDVRPGITGWAQVNGRNATEWEERFRLDTWYVDHVSFVLDLKILALTVWRVISRSGISAPAHATMPRFTGSGR